MPTAEAIIRLLDLQPHPEGGFYRETYRSSERLAHSALAQRYSGDRSISTAIYFLLTRESFSAMHKLASDEIFHFYMGGTVEMLLLKPGGGSQTVRIGPNIEQAEQLQLVVPRRWWQGSRLVGDEEFALLGCTVAPGFDFADFEEGNRAALQTAYPEAADMISRLTRV